MTRILKTILIVSATGFIATASHANEGEYYPGASKDTYSVMTDLVPALDATPTGSIGPARSATTSRDNRFIGDSGDYYEGISRR